MLTIAFCGQHEGCPSTDGLTDQRQRQHHQSARDPGEQVVQTRAGGAQPAQASLAVAQHGIQCAGCFEGPGQSERPRCVHQSCRPEASPYKHPEQRGEQAIHGIFTGRFRSGPQDLIRAELRGVTAHDPAQLLSRFRWSLHRRGWQRVDDPQYSLVEAFCSKCTGKSHGNDHGHDSMKDPLALNKDLFQQPGAYPAGDHHAHGEH